MKVALVLWLTFLNSGSATPDGALAVVPMESMQLCEKELARITTKAKHIGGICIQTQYLLQ